jgi:glycine betaine/proline transport system ATP-binding protein
MQQRVGLARALAIEPDVLFFDEPFSALDPLIRRDMQDELLRLQATMNRTIMFITHDFDEAIKLGDRIAIMKDGSFDQVGTAVELLANPATDYVREFTQDVSRTKVLTAASVTKPAAGREVDAVVDRDQAIDDFLGLLLSTTGDIGVKGGDALVGVIDRTAVVALLRASP